jgi:5-methylcytosine-specific restriction enzyme subunit McrC
VTFIELDELGPGIALRLTAEQGRALAASGIVTAALSPYEPGLWQVIASGKVGAVKVGDAEIHIRPKVQISRLLFLAGYSQRGITWQAEAVHLPEADDLIPAVAEALWRQTEHAIRQGLLPGYLVIEESSQVLRGRLREAEQLRRNHGLPLPLEIRHDEFTIDIPENRILRTACERILTVPRVTAQSQQRLRRLLHDFADVTPLRRGDPVPAWQATRLNVRYHAALYLAELVLRATSVEHGSGYRAANGFLIDMPALFEDFVTMALREAIVPSYGGRVRGQERNHFDEAGQVALRPDIVWRIRGAPVAVIDVKYKAEQPGGYPNADLYQLLAYCTVLGLRTGHLVYAKGNGEPAHHVVRRSGIEIVCHALDLDVDPPALLAQIQKLAAQIAATCPSVAATSVGHQLHPQLTPVRFIRRSAGGQGSKRPFPPQIRKAQLDSLP